MTDERRAPPSAGRNNSIGFLRLLFAGMVIYSHAYLLGGFSPEPLQTWTNGGLFAGKIGVQCFFVLSGILVARSYLRLQSPLSFLWHRLLRVVPACWFCLILTAFAFAPLVYFTSQAPSGYLQQTPSPVGYIFNNLLVPRHQIGIGNLLADNPWGTDFNGSLWTLFYEGACYLFVAGMGFLGLFGRGRLLWLAGWTGAVSGYILFATGRDSGLLAPFFGTPGKLLCLHFACGLTLAVFPAIISVVARQMWLPLLSAAGLLVCWRTGSGHIASPLLLPIVLVALSERLPLYAWEKKLGGDYSYGLYLFGYPVEQTLAHFGVQRAGYCTFLLTSFAITLALAILSWKFVEAPALRLKHLVEKSSPATSRTPSLAPLF